MGKGGDGGGATRETVDEGGHVVARPTRDVGAAGAGRLGHVTWGEVGGALDGVRGGGDRARGFGSRPTARPPLAAAPGTPAFSPLVPTSLWGVRTARARRAGCAQARRGDQPGRVGGGAGERAARPWRAAGRGAAAAGRRR